MFSDLSSSVFLWSLQSTAYYFQSGAIMRKKYIFHVFQMRTLEFVAWRWYYLASVFAQGVEVTFSWESWKRLFRMPALSLKSGSTDFKINLGSPGNFFAILAFPVQRRETLCGSKRSRVIPLLHASHNPTRTHQYPSPTHPLTLPKKGCTS